MRKNAPCSDGGGGTTSKIVDESKFLKKIFWVDDKTKKKAIEASRRQARKGR